MGGDGVVFSESRVSRCSKDGEQHAAHRSCSRAVHALHASMLITTSLVRATMPQYTREAHVRTSKTRATIAARSDSAIHND